MTQFWLLALALIVVSPLFAADSADGSDDWQKEQAQRRQGERWFRGYDADRDERISEQEYIDAEMKKVKKRFKFIDTDKDGYITAEEAIAARQKMMKLRGMAEQAGEQNNDIAE